MCFSVINVWLSSNSFILLHSSTKLALGHQEANNRQYPIDKWITTGKSELGKWEWSGFKLLPLGWCPWQSLSAFHSSMDDGLHKFQISVSSLALYTGFLLWNLHPYSAEKFWAGQLKCSSLALLWVSVSNFIDSKLDLLLWLRQIIIFENNSVAPSSYPPEGNQCFVLTVALYCVEFS